MKALAMDDRTSSSALLSSLEVGGRVGSSNPVIMWLAFLLTSPHYESPHEQVINSMDFRTPCQESGSKTKYLFIFYYTIEVETNYLTVLLRGQCLEQAWWGILWSLALR